MQWMWLDWRCVATDRSEERPDEPTRVRFDIEAPFSIEANTPDGRTIHGLWVGAWLPLPEGLDPSSQHVKDGAGYLADAIRCEDESRPEDVDLGGGAHRLRWPATFPGDVLVHLHPGRR